MKFSLKGRKKKSYERMSSRNFFPTLKNMKDYQNKHRGEAVLRKHLRTFEENQISNIIRKTKGKRRLKFHQFYSAKKYPKGYA